MTPAAVRSVIQLNQEIAFLDLREEACFATGHPLFACQLSLSRLEIEIRDRVPRQDVLVVVYDNGENLVDQALSRLGALGYSNVHALAGGLGGWRDAQYELFEDVNSYSKAFGELVETRRHTPSASAMEVDDLLRAGANVKIIDVRRFDEYNTMSIPTSTSLPGAEIVLGAPKLAPDPATTIIVNCAGRTRGIIGAQSLINTGLPNRVLALRNGTMGWLLADKELQHGQTRCVRDFTEADLNAARDRASEVAYRAGVKLLNRQDYLAACSDRTRTLFRFDIRAPEAYAAGHLSDFRNAPGGQLIQEIDSFASVRGARVVIARDEGGRAEMTASWLAQLGWEVYIYEADCSHLWDQGEWVPRTPQPPDVPKVTVSDLMSSIAQGEVTIVDLAKSSEYAAGHIPGAGFCIRSQLAQALERLPGSHRVVVTSPDGVLARFAADELAKVADIVALWGGTRAWRAAGGAIEHGLTRALVPPTDAYKRPYEGTDSGLSTMQAYLDWEAGLVEQLARDRSHGFVVI